MGPVSRQQLVPESLARGHDSIEDLRREQSLDEVVDPAVAVASGEPEDPRLRQRLEERPDLIGRTPVPVDRRLWSDVLRGHRTRRPDPVHELLDEGRMLVERATVVPESRAVPRDPVPGQLGRRNEREALVVDLEQGPLLVQEAVRHLPTVGRHAGQEHEVVVPTSDLDRVELDRAQPVEHGEDAVPPRRE